jgi:hypothetical protein
MKGTGSVVMTVHSSLLNIADLLGAQPNAADPTDGAGVVPQDRVLAAEVHVATLRGPVMASALEVGDRVLTRDSGYVALTGVRMTARAVMGEHLLIDARFAALFGSREILVADRVAVVGGRGVTLTLASAELVLADGIWVRAACVTGEVARPVLTGREADVALRMAGLGPQKHAAAAAR